MSTANAYDEVPYDGQARYHTHPDRLATLATLLGMQPAPVERCRVLEIGCGAGGNLVPMALGLPGSRFVGVDFSQRHVQTARELTDTLALGNIEWHARDIRDLGADLGLFDYILCHGVYSWVAGEVQDHILNLCKRNLAPAGVVYISYNTYPGWHLRGLVREAVRFHARRLDDPQARVPQSRAFLDFLARSLPQPNRAYAHVLKEEQERWREVADYYLFHEHLEEENRPVYFHQFAQRAAHHGLQYLGEAWQHSHTNDLTPEAAAVLRDLTADRIEREQYLDFLRNRTFRRTLLVHDSVPLEGTVQPEALRRLRVSALARPAEAPPGSAPDQVHFQTEEGIELSTNAPLIGALLSVLYEVHPHALTLDELTREIGARLHAPTEEEKLHRSVAETLVKLFLTGITGLHAYFPALARAPGSRPLAGALARLQAARGQEITNLRHHAVKLPDFDREVLALLDGRDRAALLDHLLGLAAAGELNIAREGRPIVDEEQRRLLLEPALEESLQRLAGAGLLLA